jgi:murein DD-endopeptidase MepM/ murein hydrolase activator NlpD
MKQSYRQRLTAIERESDGISLILRTAQASQSPVLQLPMVRTPLERPVTLESAFGMRRHPIFGEMRMHTGADLNGVMGQPIRAAAAGIVVLAASQDGYGNVVVLDHGNQIATAYAHMSKFSVKTGDVVARGQIIGAVGATGYATGPHLHFEYRVSGGPIDPMPHIDFDEPLPGSCEALARSKDPADAALLRIRPECPQPPTTVAPPTTVVPPTTTTQSPNRR